MKKRNTIYYEFYKIGEQEALVGMGTRTLGNTSITTGIDTVPTMTLTIPLEDLPEEVVVLDGEPNLALYLIKVYIHTEGKLKYKFIGTIDNMDIDYANYNISFNLSHRVARMREWLMPSGFVCKNMPLSHLIGKDGVDLGYSSTISSMSQTYKATVEFEYQDGAENYVMEINFSSTDKLSALSEILKNTFDLHFIVDLGDNEGDKIIIGKFGGNSGVFISSQPFYTEGECETQSDNYLTMLTEPQYAVDYTGHFNRAAVFCGDIAESVMHLTLKEIYDRPDIQKELAQYQDANGEWHAAFPVGMYDKEIYLQPETEYEPRKDNDTKYYNTTKINNEKVYENLDVVAYADNTNREYYVTDQEQFNRDGVILHTVFNFTDLTPIPELEEEIGEGENKETIEHPITDKDRLEIAKRAYIRACRKLKSQRPQKVWQFNTTPLPHGFQIGNKAELYYIKKVLIQDPDCGEKEKEVARVNKPFYVTKVVMSFDEEVNEYNSITLDNELRYRDAPIDEWKLSGNVKGSDGSTGSTWEAGHSHTDKWGNNLLDNI